VVWGLRTTHCMKQQGRGTALGRKGGGRLVQPAGQCASLSGVSAGADSGRSIEAVEAWQSWAEEMHQSQHQLYVEAKQPLLLACWTCTMHQMYLCNPNEHCPAPLLLLLHLLPCCCICCWCCCCRCCWCRYGTAMCSSGQVAAATLQPQTEAWSITAGVQLVSCRGTAQPLYEQWRPSHNALVIGLAMTAAAAGAGACCWRCLRCCHSFVERV